MSDIPQTVMDKINGYSVQFGYAYDLIKKAAIFGYQLRDAEVAQLQEHFNVLKWSYDAAIEQLTAANKRIAELEKALNEIANTRAVAYFSLVSHHKQIAKQALTPLRSPVK